MQPDGACPDEGMSPRYLNYRSCERYILPHRSRVVATESLRNPAEKLRLLMDAGKSHQDIPELKRWHPRKMGPLRILAADWPKNYWPPELRQPCPQGCGVENASPCGRLPPIQPPKWPTAAPKLWRRHPLLTAYNKNCQLKNWQLFNMSMITQPRIILHATFLI